MVHATITFLIAVPYRLNPTLIQTKVKKKKKPAKKSKKTKKVVDLSEQPVEEEEFNPHFIKCDPEMKYFCSINYKLLPSMENTISIVCWGKIAKIFAKDQVLAVRTLLRNNIAWISFSICHKIKPIKTAQVHKVREHKIQFVVESDDPKILLPKAQSDQPEIYYSHKEGELITESDHEFEIILPADSGQPGEVPSSTRRLTSRSAEDKYGTLIGIPSHLHRSHVKRQIKSSHFKLVRMGLPLSVEQELQLIKKEKGKSKKRGKKGKSKGKQKQEDNNKAEEQQNTSQLIITGDELLFDRIMWQKDQYSINSQILYAGVWLTSDTLLNEEVREHFRPIGILLTHMENLPTSDPSYKKCKRISIKYSLGSLFKQDVPTIVLKRPTSNVYIENAKVFFTNTIPPEKLLENLQTSKLFIKIYGHLLISAQTFAAMFTQEPDDEFFSKRDQRKLYPDFDLNKIYSDNGVNQSEEFLEEVLLGCAEVNCCEIIAGSFRVISIAPIKSGVVSTEEVNKLNAVDNFNALEIYDYKSTIKGVLNDGKLITNNTVIRVVINVLGPLNITLGDYLNTAHFTRIIIIFKSSRKAEKLLKRLFVYNEYKLDDTGLIPCIPYYKGDQIRGAVTLCNISSDSSISIPPGGIIDEGDEERFGEEEYRSVYRQSSIKYNETKGITLSDLITGFVIDEPDQHIFVLEGNAKVIDNVVWTQVADMKTSRGSIIYNSDLVFTKRLHEDFSSIGGIYVITMVVPINTIFENFKAFLAGYIPVPAWRALLSIKKLLESNSMQMVMQQKLLPSCRELICLDMEFGVPLYRNKSD